MIYDDGITTYFNKDKDDYELLRGNAGTMLIEASLLEMINEWAIRFPLHTNWHTG